jgi:dinuclear metal center YbgI/SA1388 family protein
MVERQELVDYLAGVLAIDNFQDYCPNGLQVQGRTEIHKVVGGVTASQALIDTAVAEQADALLVHHGFFWRGEQQEIVGIKYHRVKALIDAGINLFAYHLPLDAHRQWGNNAQLGQLLNFIADEKTDSSLIFSGQTEQTHTLESMSAHIEQQLGRQPLAIAGGDHRIRRVAWCTGAAQSYIEEAADRGVDLYISGEVSEQTVHIARERRIHYISAGHHATERYGVMSLGQHLIEKYQIDFKFIDIDNPV